MKWEKCKIPCPKCGQEIYTKSVPYNDNSNGVYVKCGCGNQGPFIEWGWVDPGICLRKKEESTLKRKQTPHYLAISEIEEWENRLNNRTISKNLLSFIESKDFDNNYLMLIYKSFRENTVIIRVSNGYKTYLYAGYDHIFIEGIEILKSECKEGQKCPFFKEFVKNALDVEIIRDGGYWSFRTKTKRDYWQNRNFELRNEDGSKFCQGLIVFCPPRGWPEFGELRFFIENHWPAIFKDIVLDEIAERNVLLRKSGGNDNGIFSLPEFDCCRPRFVNAIQQFWQLYESETISEKIVTELVEEKIIEIKNYCKRLYEMLSQVYPCAYHRKIKPK